MAAEVGMQKWVPDREELAWAAGFFDGEGSFGVHVIRGRKYAMVQVAQSDIRPLNRFQRAVGGLGKVGGPYKTSNGCKPMFQFATGAFEPAQAIVALLWNKLSEPKRDRAVAMLNTLKEEHLKVGRRPGNVWKRKHNAG